MNKELEQLDKKRIRLLQKKQISTVIKLIVFFGSTWLFYKYIGTQEYYEYLLLPLFLFLFSIFSLNRVLGIEYPLSYIKEDYYKLLLNNFLTEFHPEVKFTYNHGLRLQNTIIRGRFKLFTYDHVETYQLKYHNLTINVCNTIFVSNYNKNTIFNLQILRIKFKGKKFPKTEFQGAKKHSFFNLNKQKQNLPFHIQLENSKLFYSTEDPIQFEEKIKPLVPFITHLISKGSKTNVFLKNDEIIFLTKEINFSLDYPIKSIKSSFLKKPDAEKLARKINTVLLIADSLNNEKNQTEVEERLELKMLELIKKENKE